jgi:hypothetical protein
MLGEADDKDRRQPDSAGGGAAADGQSLEASLTVCAVPTQRGVSLAVHAPL